MGWSRKDWNKATFFRLKLALSSIKMSSGTYSQWYLHNRMISERVNPAIVHLYLRFKLGPVMMLIWKGNLLSPY